MEALEASGRVMRGSSNLDKAELLRLVDSQNTKDSVVQVFDPSAIISDGHVLAAYVNAGVSFRNHTNISSKRQMELLLFVAMTKHIDIAIERAGIKSGDDFVVFSNSEKALRSIGSKARFSKFSHSQKERAAIAKRYGIEAADAKAMEIEIMRRMASSRLE